MAEDEKDEKKEGAEEAPAAKSNKKLYLIIGGVVLLLVAAGVPAIIMMRGGEKKASEELAEDAAEGRGNLEPEGLHDEEELVEGEEPLGAIFPLETFVLNLKGNRFIRLQAQLEFVEREVPRRFYLRIVPIRDKIIEIVSAKSDQDLQTTKDKDQLKSEIKNVVNNILKKEEVKNVYFSQFIVQ